MAVFYFAWVAEGVAFDPAVHNREDEKILSFEIDHSEGNFASLKIELQNPKVGLLGAGRNLWCWLSWNNGSGVASLFNGRLIGIPESVADERISLQFRAVSNSYWSQKAALADTLKVAPYWDPLWVQDRLDDPDTVLETYSAAWHVDRTSLIVTISDLLVGEAGTLDVSTAEHVYDALKLSYGSPPIKRAKMSATATWTQAGSGTVDLTEKIVAAFQDAGSPYKSPLIASLTGDGLLTNWPKAKASLGGGWLVGDEATIEWADWVEAPFKTYVYTKAADATSTSDTTTIDSRPGSWKYTPGPSNSLATGWHFSADKVSTDITGTTWETWAVIFPLGVLKIYFPAGWTASRKRSETVTLTLEADIQPLVVDPDESYTLTSNYVDQAIDAADALPIGDARKNAYFPTDRGLQSLEYLIMYCRAKLRSRARAVVAEFTAQFAKVAALDCRWNVILHDGRLPGGQATGKVTRVQLSLDGASGEMKGVVTLGFAVGYANTVSPAAGVGAITEADVLAAGVQVMTGAQIDPGTADIYYDSLDDLTVLDDDGVDLFNMTPGSVVSAITITDGVTNQLSALSGFKTYDSAASLPFTSTDPSNDGTDTPGDILTKHYTKAKLDLVAISNRSFETAYPVTLSQLMVPKGIDLEAA